MKHFFLLALIFSTTVRSFAQNDRWQQRIKYNIDVNLDVHTNRLKGTESIDYWNNSPDTLKRVFFHLYWNAFQPGSSMDVRSRELGKIAVRQDRKGNPIYDWDRRVKDTISKLKPDEAGYQKVLRVLMNGRAQQLIVHETILEVVLDKPIAAKSKTSFTVEFEAQVPLQIRRAGRDNAEGIRYSIAQWYPKLSEYDVNGWNPNPYIAREFYGVWGDYDVKITLDKTYVVGATGVLQNPDQVGYGYTTKLLHPDENARTLTWKFSGSNIHDFVWTADPDYKHISKKIREGLTVHVLYQPKDAGDDSAWRNVLWMAEKVLPFMEQKFGKYPWPSYSFLQGGDGGMEYAMATLVKDTSLGTAMHEWMHSWYQQLLGTNESLYPWMDEGFTTWAEDQVMDYYLHNWANQSPYINDKIRLANNKKIAENDAAGVPLIHFDSYKRYYALQKSPFDEPMITHSDHYNTNYAYTTNAYSRGSIFLEQLGYIVGAKVRDSIMIAYYNQWKFKHPTADDFIRVAERVSGMELDWYKEYWVNTVKPIDYTVSNVSGDDNRTQVTLKRVGKMPMPIDVVLTFKDGSKELHYIPLDLMYGIKPAEDSIPRTVHAEWRWVVPEYTFESKRALKDLKSVEIDPSGRMADIDRRALVIPD